MKGNVKTISYWALMAGIIVVIVFCFVGCAHEIKLSPRFQNVLDQSAIEAREWSSRIDADEVNCSDLEAYVKSNAQQWSGFQAAAKGVTMNAE